MTRMTGPDCVVMCNLINTYIHTYIHKYIHTYIHTHIITYIHTYKATALKTDVWVDTVTEGGRRFMAAWRKEEVDAARHRQEKREATSLGKLLSHTEA